MVLSPVCQEELTASGKSRIFAPMKQQETLEIYTDGGCSGNPGPGGWAFVMSKGGKIFCEQSGGESLTTNNKMELTAVIKSLKAAQSFSAGELIIHTDSQYVKNGITQWIHTWKKNGWRTAAKDPVKNREYWEELDELASTLPIAWRWVKGHSGIELNERCDAMVRQEMDKLLNG